MANEFVARNGIIALNNSIITGSLNVTQGVTASLFGTSSWATNALSSSYILSAVSASFASTASNVLGGAANYIPLFNTATTLSSSVMYQSSGNVGIGTTSPAYKLDVNGTGNFANRLSIGSNTNTAQNAISALNNSSAQATIYSYNYDATGYSIYSAQGINYFSGSVGIGTISPFRQTAIFNAGSALLGFDSTANGRATIGIDNVGRFVVYDDTIGAYRLVINTSGNVGIGTSSPSARLHVSGSTTTNLLVGTSDLFVSASGNVGIRTTDSYGQLTIGNITNNLGGINFAEASDASSRRWQFRNDVTVFGDFALRKSTTQTGTTFTDVLYINTSNNVGIGTTSPSAKLHVSGANSDSLLLVASPGATSALFVSGSGNVGIGEINPTSKLVIKDLSTSVYQIINGGAGSTAGITFQNNSVEQLIIRSRGDISRSTISSQVWDFELGTNADKDLLLYTNAQERVRINNGGSVGIGTSSPNAKLDVNGNTIITGSLTVTSTITAQTLVVQTITSSVDFVTGSTRFGTILSNTHQFTGSVGMTGSLTVAGTTTTTDLAVNGSNTTFNTTNTTINSSNVIVGNDITDLVGIAGNTMYFPGSGNVGIGTTSPGAKLEVSGTIRNVTFSNSFTNSYTAAFGNTRIIGSSNPQLELWHDGNSVGQFSFASSILNYGIHTGAGTQTTYLTISNTGNVGIGTTSPSARLHVSGSTTTNLLVGTSDLFVSASGNVGIGTTSPTATLAVQSSIYDAPGGTNKGAFQIAFNNTNGVSFGTYNASPFGNYIQSIDYRQGNNNTYPLLLNPIGNNVGIGTTVPNAKLDVNGNTIITGSLTVITGSSIELQVLNTGVRIGNIVTDTHTVTGSLSVSGSITGSLFGTASFAVSASWAPGGSGGTVSEPIPAAAKLYLFYNY